MMAMRKENVARSMIMTSTNVAVIIRRVLELRQRDENDDQPKGQHRRRQRPPQ
jgi:hypothetical protein